VTPDQHQRVRKFARDLGVQQSQEALLIQVRQGVEILNACGLYDAADQLERTVTPALWEKHSLDMTRVDL
jgi:hypothetical protein